MNATLHVRTYIIQFEIIGVNFSGPFMSQIIDQQIIISTKKNLIIRKT